MSDAFHRTPLYDLHLRLGARMVGFAGYEMPLQYPAGVMTEHLHTRRHCGLFDVSHMGQIELSASEGGFAEVARALEALIPIDILGLQDGRQRYGFFTLPNGGLLDDLMLARRGERIFMVVNASRKVQDLAHLVKGLGSQVKIAELSDRALLALQGPDAVSVLSRICPKAASMRFMDVVDVEISGVSCILSRSGYTGEDGYEISLPASEATGFAETLLAETRVMPIGLGARDSLRLEAGLCLYGQDIDEDTTPVASSLQWAVQKIRRSGGERAGGFPGEDKILSEFPNLSENCRVGLLVEGRAPIRAGVELFSDAEGTHAIGRVTSGAFGPSCERPVAMGYVLRQCADTGHQIFASLRGRLIPVKVAALPFIVPGYSR